MARLWEIREDYEPEYHHGSNPELLKAYKEGCKHGYKKAMKEMEEHEYRGYRESPSYRDDDDDDYGYRRRMR